MTRINICQNIKEEKTKMLTLTFHLVMSNDTYEMHDPTNAPLGLPPIQLVAWGPWSIVSNKIHWKEEGNPVRICGSFSIKTKKETRY
jgi:hypothetical protein